MKRLYGAGVLAGFVVFRADPQDPQKLSVSGNLRGTGSGKSTLIEFLWRLCGRADYEGFDASKSSAAARGRNFSQISNLPVCLIESDRVQDNPKLKAFDWEELKSLYNGRNPFIRCQEQR